MKPTSSEVYGRTAVRPHGAMVISLFHVKRCKRSCQ